MNEHEREEIFRSRPDYPEGDATHRQDNNRVGNRIDRACVGSEPISSHRYSEIEQ